MPNAAAGEDIRILDLAEQPLPAGLADLDHDFWLIDDVHAIRMRYDQDGRFLGATPVDGGLVAGYQAARDAALAAAEPFTTWRARHQAGAQP